MAPIWWHKNHKDVIFFLFLQILIKHHAKANLNETKWILKIFISKNPLKLIEILYAKISNEKWEQFSNQIKRLFCSIKTSFLTFNFCEEKLSSLPKCCHLHVQSSLGKSEKQKIRVSEPLLFKSPFVEGFFLGTFRTNSWELIFLSSMEHITVS